MTGYRLGFPFAALSIAVCAGLGWMYAHSAPALYIEVNAAALVVAAVVACLPLRKLGPYPTPLIGYGASPILGYGLALAVLGTARS